LSHFILIFGLSGLRPDRRTAAVVVAGGDDEASGLAAWQCRDLPPLPRAAVAGEFSLEVPYGALV
jgi:hypothetical protein